MCLVTKESEPRIAKSDILAKKLIVESNNELFRSPFMHTVHRYNKVLWMNYQESNINNLEFIPYNPPYESYYHVEDGLHSYKLAKLSVISKYLAAKGFTSKSKNKKKIRDYHDELYDHYKATAEIKLAIIPKGSQYCVGNNGDYVSNKLIVFDSLKSYLKYKLFNKLSK